MLAQAHIQQVLMEGLYLVLLISAPPVLASLVVGLLVSLLQATTQVQDQTLTFVPKLVAVFVALAAAGPWIGGQVVRFTRVLLESLPMIR